MEKISFDQIIGMRLALEQIASPSQPITDSKEILDKLIHTYFANLKTDIVTPKTN